MRKAIQPKLRFPEFNDNWSTSTLGTVAEFSKGKGVSKSDIVENGLLECIRYGELYTHYGEVIDEIKSRTNLDPRDLVLSEKNDVIIPASGETQIDIATASCVLKSGIALGGDLNIIKSPLDGVFLSYYLNNKKKHDIASIAQGISVVHLYASQLKAISINIPQQDEQQKIASFLKSVDGRIALLKMKKEKLEKYKDYAIRLIFCQKIRFKDENGNDFPDWREMTLGQLGSTFNGLTGKTKVDFGVGKPYVQYMQIFSNSKINMDDFGLVNIGDSEKQNRVQYGDVFFTTSSETPLEIGTASVLIDHVDEVYLNSFCFGYRPTSLKQLVPEFARYLFRSQIFRNEIIKLAQGSTRFNMSKVELMKIKTLIPDEKEQIKIGSFLTTIDNSLDLIKTEIEQMVEFKNGLLQRMFI